MSPFELASFPPGVVPEKFERLLVNSAYVVVVHYNETEWGKATVLSIRRQDRKPIMDWRDMQWIKNQILGEEAECVQLFPAEGRLIDTSNQYFLYCFPEKFPRFPFGFRERLVTESVSRPPGAKSGHMQRPFADHVRPDDLDACEERTKQLVQQLPSAKRVLFDGVGDVTQRTKPIPPRTA